MDVFAISQYHEKRMVKELAESVKMELAVLKVRLNNRLMMKQLLTKNAKEVAEEFGATENVLFSSELDSYRAEVDRGGDGTFTNSSFNFSRVKFGVLEMERGYMLAQGVFGKVLDQMTEFESFEDSADCMFNRYVKLMKIGDATSRILLTSAIIEAYRQNMREGYLNATKPTPPLFGMQSFANHRWELRGIIKILAKKIFEFYDVDTEGIIH